MNKPRISHFGTLALAIAVAVAAVACGREISGSIPFSSTSIADFYPLTAFVKNAGSAFFYNGGVGSAGATGTNINDWAMGVRPDGYGRYILFGSSENAANGTELAMWRWSNDGTVDTSFGTNGYILLNHSGTGFAGAIGAGQ